jgi:hypothetical protein
MGDLMLALPQVSYDSAPVSVDIDERLLGKI